MGYYVYLWHIGTSVCLHIKKRLESGPVTANLTTTVIHNYKLLINDIKPIHSLIDSLKPCNPANLTYRRGGGGLSIAQQYFVYT